MPQHASRDHSRSLTLQEFVSDAAMDDVLDLSCPGCGSDLLSDKLYDSHRICGTCQRHFPMRPREQISLLTDVDSFLETNQVLLSADPVRFGNIEQSEIGEGDALAEAVVTGVATFGGREAVVVAMDDALIGPMLGAVISEKTLAAFELALQRHIPCVLVISGGTARVDPGTLALVQHNRLAATFARLHVAGVPVVGVVTHPTSASMFQSLASHCDLLVSEPGARIGVWGAASVGGTDGPDSPEDLMASGLLDSVVSRSALRGFLGRLMDLITSEGGGSRPSGPGPRLEQVLPSAREALAAAQHSARPTARDVAAGISTGWVPVRGDRLERDEDTVIGGITRVHGTALVMIALDRSAGMPSLSSVRKATRLARLAGHLDLPLLILVDTPPAALRQPAPFPVGNGAARLASVLSLLPVPVVSIVVGVAAGPLGLAALQADRVLMQANAVMCSIAGESHHPLGGLRRAADEFGTVAPAHECVRLGIADAVIAEPRPSADIDPESANQAVCHAAIAAIAEISAVGQRRLLDRREHRLRTLGQSTPAGRAAASHEVVDLQDWQRSLSETIDELRDRWEQRRQLPARKPIQRPDLGELASRLRARRTELLERTGISDRLASLEDELRARQAGRDQESPEQ